MFHVFVFNSNSDFLLYAQFGELKTVSEVKRQDGDSIERTSVAGRITSSYVLLENTLNPFNKNKEYMDNQMAINFITRICQL